MTVSIHIKNEGSRASISARVTVQERVYRDGVPTELWKDVETTLLASTEDLASYLTSTRRVVVEEVESDSVQRVVLTDSVDAND